MSELDPSRIPANTRALVLDWDDTVVATREAKVRQHIFVAKEQYGIDLTFEEMAVDWGRPLHELIQKWYRVEGGSQAYQDVLRTVFSHSKDFPKQLFDGVHDVVDAARNAGLPVGIVTGSPSDDLVHDFENTGFTKASFDYFQASEDTEFHKPDPRVFDPLMKWLGARAIAPADVLYIGDSLPDYQAARGAGFMFLGVETGVVDAQKFHDAGILSIGAISQLLKRMQNS